MLKFRYRRCTSPEPAVGPSLAERPDLRIRNLLDDPRLRRSMGLPPVDGDDAGGDLAVPRLERRLLDRAAA